jgi:hypothetical protein
VTKLLLGSEGSDVSHRHGQGDVLCQHIDVIGGDGLVVAQEQRALQEQMPGGGCG